MNPGPERKLPPRVNSSYAWELEDPPVTDDDVAFYEFFENVLMSLGPGATDDSLDLGDGGRRLWHEPASEPR